MAIKIAAAWIIHIPLEVVLGWTRGILGGGVSRGQGGGGGVSRGQGGGRGVLRGQGG